MTNIRWIRRDGAVLVERGATLTVIGADEVVRQFDESSTALIRIVLEVLQSPHTEAELGEEVRAIGGACEDEVIADVLRVLAGAGAIAPAPAQAPPGMAQPSRGRIVLGVSGAIAAVEVPGLARLLTARGFEVSVVLSRAARKFVTAESLAAITHRAVHTSFWSRVAGAPAPHIQLSTWADLVIVYPATAATLARIASGATDDLIAATVVASTCPVLLAPSMNEAMYSAPSVQRNLEQLREDGHYLVHPRFGHEVATAPEARTARFGAAPSPHELMRAIELVWQTAVQARRVDGPDSWEQQYATVPVERLPWYTTALDRDLVEALEKRAAASTPVRLLDVGTGPGTTAIFAAERGFEVVATDVSATALTIAKRRAGRLPIAWVLDDFAESRLWGQFDVVVDRGCLHCLPRAQWQKYADQVSRLIPSGGQLLLKQHAPEETGRGTRPPQAGELEALFGASFDITSVAAAFLDGTIDPPPRAQLATLTRK